MYGGAAGAIAQLEALEAWFAVQRDFHFYSSSGTRDLSGWCVDWMGGWGRGAGSAGSLVCSEVQVSISTALRVRTWGWTTIGCCFPDAAGCLLVIRCWAGADPAAGHLPSLCRPASCCPSVHRHLLPAVLLLYEGDAASAEEAKVRWLALFLPHFHADWQPVEQWSALHLVLEWLASACYTPLRWR